MVNSNLLPTRRLGRKPLLPQMVPHLRAKAVAME